MATPEQSVASYFRYWGKAKPTAQDSARYHLLALHSLDVAACGQLLLQLPQYCLKPLARELSWPLEVVNSLAVFFLLTHDAGKFSRGFQGLAPGLSPELVQNDKGKPYRYRHDTLGWLLWTDVLASKVLPEHLPNSEHGFWAMWARTAVGHHGKPPLEGGEVVALEAGSEFLRDDIRAASEFVLQVAQQWLPVGIPEPTRAELQVLRRHAWRLAGLAVLADWLGSDQRVFSYQSTPMTLADYWEHCALPRARTALQQAGLRSQPVRAWSDPLALFEHVRKPTPLQQYAASVELQSGPQLFLLEDVTGAGKTEAALVLAQRLMQQGLAQGLYFALPSMATANQMYQRVGGVYRYLYEPGTDPSLVLAHGARDLIDGFRDSVVAASAQPKDQNYSNEEASASAQCNAWLADSRKKALLADAGVGTLDQALLGVLPTRHQSLRLLGLAAKVLVVDEVHSYDAYMRTLLCRLLGAHARQGGSAILLSATLPAFYRAELVQAFRAGLGLAADEVLPDARYPLSTQASREILTHACETRPQLVRRVQVMSVHDEDDALALVVREARAGRCVCWVRNTVEDARCAFDLLREQLAPERVDLFHSRFAIGDRLDIESRVLRDFGKDSTAAVRHGRVLVGTQVLEQSLDFCVDVMVSDHAPIDALIQRAGRLQRHARLADGTPAADGIEQRPAPVLYVLMPRLVDEPAHDWYSELFPKACYVYPNVGELWRGARALMQAGCIVSPGVPGEAGAVRSLVEAVYGEQAEAIPSALLRATNEQLGKDLAAHSLGSFHALNLDRGYCWDSSPSWHGEVELPTRLGDETRTLYLALECDGELVPWRHDVPGKAWEMSALRVDARRITGLSADDEERWGAALQALRAQHPLLEAPALILPLSATGTGWRARAASARGDLDLYYDTERGLYW